MWQWVRRESGKPSACREIAFVAGQSGDHLLQRLQPLFVSLDEESSLNIALVASRVRAALDVERVTKRFYERFRTELTAFGEFIDGITAQGDRDWYASLMLNRMMFVYFVQKRGFLDGDLDYLRNRLKHGSGTEAGTGASSSSITSSFCDCSTRDWGSPKLRGRPISLISSARIPFLNGGLFDVHDLERDNPDISIPDKAFERVFRLLRRVSLASWTSGPTTEDNEINPDVLGYIFEKYVNQKQMGAYYTKGGHHRLHLPQHRHPLFARRRQEGVPRCLRAGRRRVAAAA